MTDETESRNRALTYRWFDEVWNNGRDATIEELFAPDGVCHGLAEDGGRLTRPAAFRRFYEPFRDAFPDVKVTVEQVLADGDETVARLSARGTHGGAGLGQPPTGKVVTFTAMVWVRWRDGQIVAGWNELDTGHLLRQLTAPQDAAVTFKAK